MSYSIHLRSLQGFVTELETQRGALAKAADLIDGLAAEPIRFGGFVEADALSRLHGEVAADILEVLGAAQQAVGFAEEVTGAVVAEYRSYDEAVAASYRGLEA